MSVVKKLAFAAIALAVMTGCASTTAPKDTLLQVSNPRASLAGSLVSLAGYPGLIPDNSYGPNLDAAINAGTMATLLPSDLGVSTFSAAGIGFALTSLQGTYPMDENFSMVMLVPITDASELNNPDYIKNVMLSSFEIRKTSKFDRADLAAILAKANINDMTCEAYGNILDQANFTHSCSIKTIPWDEMIRVAGIYQGDRFDRVMPSVRKGKFAVIFLRSSGQLAAKKGIENVFSYKNGTLSNSIAVLPFISANSQGKHLVYLNGKATLI